MKAVGLYQDLPNENEQSLVDVQIEQPQPTGKDLLSTFERFPMLDDLTSLAETLERDRIVM